MSVAATVTAYVPVVTEEGTCQEYVQTATELPCVIAVSVTTPAIETKGVAAMLSEKVAVTVTTPLVIILSESLLVIVAVVWGQVPQMGLLACVIASPKPVP